MKSNYPEIQQDRQKAYDLLVNSHANWTLVRVPFIEFSNAKGDVAIDINDCLCDKSYDNKAPFIYST